MTYSARLAVLCLIACTLAGQSAPIRGLVVDSAGSPIPRAMVLIHQDTVTTQVSSSETGAPPDLTLQTDEHGRFTAQRPPGFYDVFVASAAFTPTSRKVRHRLTPGPELTFRLQVDPLVGNEIGTRIEASKAEPAK